MNASVLMPQYQCHKKVWALKIDFIAPNEMIHPLDKQYAPFRATDDWLERYRGTEIDEGYYVVYDDGYASWSPSKAFEDGYSLIK